MLHFRSLLGTLGHHFGSFGGPFWEPKSLILAPWGALGTQTGPNQKKKPNTSKKTFILEVNLASFFDVFFGTLLDGIFAILCAKVVSQRALLGAILETFPGPV